MLSSFFRGYHKCFILHIDGRNKKSVLSKKKGLDEPFSFFEIHCDIDYVFAAKYLVAGETPVRLLTHI